MLSWVEIDSKAIKYNLKQFRRLIGPKVLLMPVIKANAYGHGFLEIAKICAENKDVDRICVVNLDEAVELIKNKIKKSIQILSFYELDNKKIYLAVKHNVIFPVYDITQVKFLDRVGERLEKNIKVHIKVDTGAARLGILPKQVIDFVKKITKFKNIKIEGIFSHFASSEDDKIYTEHQLNIFNKITEKLKQDGINIPIKHFACSAAGILYAQSRFNAIRIGVSMYGLYPDELSRKKLHLKPALSWFTTIIQIKTVPAWTKIGYGGSFTTKKITKLAIIPVGYWDGYDRRLSNNSEVIIKGKKCPVRGRICMNLTIIDVSAVKNIKIGERVILIGGKKNCSITVDDIAHHATTINYEVVDRINPLLIRVIKK
ncbi:MAG: alanine racemase [Candidatus Magasanikbacteria bacterium]